MLDNTQIIYQDSDILAVYKPAGLATQTSSVVSSDLVSDVRNYIMRSGKIKGGKTPFVGLINRLDQPVEGLVLFGLNKAVTAALTKQLGQGEIHKGYCAALSSIPGEPSAELVDFLVKDKNNTSSVCDSNTPGAKRAVLRYEIAKSTDEIALVKIRLMTGRHHQIRVQMAAAGYPLMGDLKYGSPESISKSREKGIRSVALCSCSLSFIHPVLSKRIELNIEPKGDWYKFLCPGRQLTIV